MSKRIIKYKLLGIRLFNNLTVVLVFLAFWVANPVSASAQTDNQIPFIQNEIDLTSLPQDISAINLVSVHEYLELSNRNFPDSIPTDSEKEKEEENEEDDNFAALKRQLLIKNLGYNQLYNQQVYLNYQRKKLPLYLLFHSWKSHLI